MNSEDKSDNQKIISIDQGNYNDEIHGYRIHGDCID